MQDKVTEFLKSPSGHPGGGQVEVVQTHGALIFLAGEIALKMKRSVRYDYMDLSTLDLREKMLRRELALNKPVAPRIYRDVIPVTRSPDGSLALDGEGCPVEWVLRMWRFPAENELSVIAEAGGIGDTLANDLGAEIFAFHDQTPQRRCDGAGLIRGILNEFDRVFPDMAGTLGAPLINDFREQSRAVLDQTAPLLQHRGETGHVRRCHGDLHLGNLVLLDGKPVPFDALEFDEVLGTCDVLYDLAFLIMDLWHRDLDRAANMVLNAYLLTASGGEDEGLTALPLFIAVRAAIRAMVLVQTATSAGSDACPEAVQYLKDGLAVLSPAPVSLVLVGGMSGTGKTTVARALAPLIGATPGAIHLRSDLERKVMRGADAQTRLAREDYNPAARSAVYDRLFNRAGAILSTGHSVLLDATFLDAETRGSAERTALEAGATLKPLWLDAPLSNLIDRVRARFDDASDADERVVRQQFMADTAPTDWQVISAAGSVSETITLAKTALMLPAEE